MKTMKINLKYVLKVTGCCVLVLAIQGCEIKNRKKVMWEAMDTPVMIKSEQPFLLAHEEELSMLWTEELEDRKVALLMSSYSNGHWEDRNELTRGEDWFVNWADFPALSKNGKNVIAHYLKKSDTATFSYDIRFLHSASNGVNWSNSVKMHSDTMKAEHGFVSFSPVGEDSFRAVWLDGRNSTEGGHHGMQLRSAEIGADGKIVTEELVDEKTCDCCQTSVVQTSEGTLVAYRDRTDDEIRDIYVSLLSDGKWSEPKAIFNDGWKINGCPVNGPKLSAIGSSAGLAWFTGANDQPRVKVAFSDDGGLNFGDPLTVDEGKPLGRVDLFMLDENTALLSWMEMNEQDAELRLAVIDKLRGKLTSMTVSELSSARSTGFPQLEVAGGEVFLAWNEETPQGRRIKLVKTNLQQIYP